MRTSDSELTAIQAPAAIDKAPATATVSPATKDCERIPERGEEAADGPQDLDQAIIQSEENVSHARRIEFSLRIPGHDLILVLELVLEDVPNRGTKWAIAVGAPDPQILAHTVDLYRLQHEMNRGLAEKPADGHE